MSEYLRPRALLIVAIIFLLGGIWAGFEMVIQALNSYLNLNFGVLGIFIGPGLLRGSRGWRTCALVLIWIVLILSPLFAILVMTSGGPLNLSFLGQDIGSASPLFGVLFALGVFVFYLWLYRTLVRADVRRYFDLPERGEQSVPPKSDRAGG